jgi:hypothetical protein
MIILTKRVLVDKQIVKGGAYFAMMLPGTAKLKVENLPFPEL